MTATVAAAANVLTAVTRADQEWCRNRTDDPLDDERREHFAAAIQARLTGPTDDATAASFDQRLDDVRAELGKHVAAQQRRAERAEQHGNELGEQILNEHRALEAVQRERDTKLAELTEALEERDQARAEVKALARRLADEQAETARLRDQVDHIRDEAARVGQHVCRYPWPDPTKPPGPCDCGRPWPRLRAEDTEEVPADTNPWDDVWARLRAELDGWGTSPRRRRTTPDKATTTKRDKRKCGST